MSGRPPQAEGTLSFWTWGRTFSVRVPPEGIRLHREWACKVTFLMGAAAFGLVAARTARSLADGPGFPPLAALPLACATFFGIGSEIFKRAWRGHPSSSAPAIFNILTPGCSQSCGKRGRRGEGNGRDLSGLAFRGSSGWQVDGGISSIGRGSGTLLSGQAN